jgi:hypothetical protein
MPGPDPDVPIIRFSQRRLPNGLRVIVAPDHLAPVVAMNLWYDVGSKHEPKGRTGFAHLFEHFMFQGSAHVAKTEHMAIVQGQRRCNATTYFDRTNYFETLPSNQLDIGLWLEADRMATLLEALNQENLDNQRDVVKNEKRQSYDNRPYGPFYERLIGAVFPAGHPYHHTIGSRPRRRPPADVQRFFRDWYAPNNCVISIVGDVDEAGTRGVERWFGAIPAIPRWLPGPGSRATWAPGSERRCSMPCRSCASTSILTPVSARRPSMRRGGRVIPGWRRAAGSTSARARASTGPDVTPSRCPWSAAPLCAGWATVRPEVDPAAVETAHGRLAANARERREPTRSSNRASWRRRPSREAPIG